MARRSFVFWGTYIARLHDEYYETDGIQTYSRSVAYDDVYSPTPRLGGLTKHVSHCADSPPTSLTLIVKL